MSTIKVDTLQTRTGSGNLTVDTDTLVVDTTNNNVFVKKTSAAYQTVGHELKSDGRAFHTSNGGKALSLVRNTSNGAIMDFYNSGGTEVGSIETSSSGIGIKLGGTASTNLLDDYEEGTFSGVGMSAASGGAFTITSQDNAYVKIGKFVKVRIKLVFNSPSSASGNITLSGLPFTANGVQGMHIIYNNQSASYNNDGGFFIQGGTTTAIKYGYANSYQNVTDFQYWLEAQYITT